MGIVICLISLYLLNANGIIVPDGCFIVAWSFSIVTAVATLLSAIGQVMSDKKIIKENKYGN